MTTLHRAMLALPLLLIATPAHADLPEAARAMIEAALETGDADTVEAVIATARSAFPDDAEEIDAIWTTFRTEQAVLAAAEAAAAEQELRQAGLFDNWSGEGQIGGFQASGNSDEFGVTAALALEREGIDWEHRLRLSGDYRRQEGETSREQIFARYEPRYQVSERLFTYGLAQFERNVQQGFGERYSVSGGLGYRVLDSDDIELSVQAGPAYRVTNFLDGTSTDRIAALLGLDFDWDITDSLKLTQDTNATAETGGEVLVLVDGASTSILATTGLEAGLSDSLSARLSWTLDYDSNPPDGAVTTDTLTRFTLIYGF
ncbi:DUF481 domain-containing protein [Aurantiacibacter gangjinensis]|uniref:Membrane protein n=1 Tax=Aurantiacibacter gangjinensis TaxID=502682 RepID=A0A0G9MQ30_9SPHN|nr:DUF481 domain-containing protein [Aurantiacibacter gangjinensis]APE28646.1 putative salt-induced outer membrane protein [Aurantiacibacter gangjinensis]KLE32820.1 membrane protein [Aurantiacibacter gangjinensis]